MALTWSIVYKLPTKMSFYFWTAHCPEKEEECEVWFYCEISLG